MNRNNGCRNENNSDDDYGPHLSYPLEWRGWEEREINERDTKEELRCQAWKFPDVIFGQGCDTRGRGEEMVQQSNRGKTVVQTETRGKNSCTIIITIPHTIYNS